ncbi:hypothetical protein H0H93_007836 [Arthromyces matolae]|nr:hypothetical protein H0H93_007836 [Arthromyces matolae]
MQPEKKNSEITDLLARIIDQETTPDVIALHTLEKVSWDFSLRKAQVRAHDYEFPLWRDATAVKEYAHPKVWRLMESDPAGDPTDEEIVFTIYGALSEDKKKVKYLKQSLTLEGYDTQEFRDALTATKSIHAMFDRFFKEGQLEAITDVDTISAANRLLTPSKDTSGDDVHIPYDKESDPEGLLEELAREGFKRTDDNIVNFIQRRKNQDGDYKAYLQFPGSNNAGKTSVASIQTTPVKRKVRKGTESEESESEGIPKKIWRGMTGMNLAGDKDMEIALDTEK